jgi:hypothetical protein
MPAGVLKNYIARDSSSKNPVSYSMGLYPKTGFRVICLIIPIEKNPEG